MAAFIVATAGLSHAQTDAPQSVIQKLEHGQINWTDKTIVATGSGAPNVKLSNVARIRLAAERAAKLDAYRNIIEGLKGMKVSAEHLGAKALGKPQIRTQVQGIVRGCKTMDTRYYSDGGVDVVLQCPLDGSLSTVLAPVSQHRPLAIAGEVNYTGLILDATGLVVSPVLSPVVVDGAGKELYSAAMVTPTTLRQSGAVKYVRTVDAAKAEPGLGKNPLIMKVVESGNKGADFKVSAEDALKLEGQNLTFLAEGRVIVVTGGS